MSAGVERPRRRRDWSKVGPVVLSMGGRITEHPSLEGAVRCIGWRKIDDLRKNGERRLPVFYLTIRPMDETPRIYDEIGMRIPLWRILEAASGAALETPDDWAVRWNIGRRGPYVFRRGPVGGTGGYSRSGSMYHRMRTQGERRDACALMLDEDAVDQGIRPRASRSADALPNYWDELVTAKPLRSWKKHRSTQWRDR
jgi:hypothetical protein